MLWFDVEMKRLFKLEFAHGGRLGLRRFAPFSLPPRAISDNEAKSASCCAETPFFLYAVDPYESKLSTARRHTKNLATLLRDFALIVIRLGFAKVRCFTAKSHTLLTLLLLVNTLIYSVINVFVSV